MVTIIDDYDAFNPTVEEILSNCDSTSNFLLTKNGKPLPK